ncbi:MAG: aminotransferase class III-fold pyridoxal phosphate-dependent enzyme [Thermodesulfobacteriota bacterium]
MDAQEIKRLDREHHLHSWSVQGVLDPIVFDRAQGSCFWDAAGKRYLDFSAQLMNQNTGHQHPKVVKAIQDQAAKVCFCAPGMAYESKSALVAELLKVTPGDLKHFFFTLGGADANENAVKIARLYTKKFKIVSRYRSYHGATFGAITLTGDPRRPPVEPGIPGVVRVFDPYCYRCSFGLEYPGCDVRCARNIEEVILYENPDTVAAIIMEGVCGSNGIFVPPPEYLPTVREICDRYGVLLISDEVMSGFGRTGQWFAVNNWNVVPDIITMAKGLTSGYLPLGGAALSKKIADYFQKNMLWGGLTYNAHPLCCAAAVATLQVYHEENLIERARTLGSFLMKELGALQAKHPCVGDARGIGLFTVLELVKDRKTREPLVPWNAAGPDLALNKEINKRLLAGGVYTFVRWNWVFVVPPLVVSQDELKEGLAVIDDVLTFVDGQIK